MSKLQDVTVDTFTTEVEQAGMPVLVDFWAPWCGPCRMVTPVLERVAAEREGKLKVVKVDIDKSPGLAERFEIRSIPCVILFAKGQPTTRITGAVPKSHFDRALDDALA